MSRDLARLEQTKADLTNMIVHDLKNPLGVVISSLGLLQMMAEKHPLPDNQARMVNMSLENGERLLAMVHTLLDVTRLEDGALVLHQEAVSLAPLIAEATEGPANLAAAGGKELIVQVAADLPPVRADRELVRRVLDNLLSNALEYTWTGGHIWLSARRDPEGERALVTIRDDGEGIPAEVQTKLVRALAQLEAAPEPAEPPDSSSLDALAGRESPFHLPPEGIELESVERELLVQALDRAGGNKSRAARLVGLGRHAFLYRLKKYGPIRQGKDGTSVIASGAKQSPVTTEKPPVRRNGFVGRPGSCARRTRLKYSESAAWEPPA